MWHEEVSSDRKSELRSERASSGGVYSVGISSEDIKPGLWFLSVNCKHAGISDTGGGGGDRLRFRVAALAIHRDLEIGHIQYARCFDRQVM